MNQLFTYHNRFALNILFVLSLLMGANAAAQTNPVQANITTTGPYLNYLSYYGDQNNHLQITLTNLDFTLPPVLVRLRIRIEGSGYELYTNPNATIGQPFLLEPGMPLTISGFELLPYLQQNNLINPSGVDLNDLPHGFTNICVDVIRESAQQQVLSSDNCGFLPIQEYQPPQAFVPNCGDQLDTNTMFHTFTWTPPVPFPAGADLELFYDFKIHHWIDPNNNSALGGNSILVYQENDLIAPTTQVSDFDIQWDHGGTYIWTVTARVESNGMPISLIENGGVSAPCTFVYGEALTLNDQLADGLQIELFADPLAERKGKAWWTVTDNTPNQGLSQFDEYFVEYRKQPTGNEGFEIPWFSKTLTSSEHFIYQLEPSTTYEVRVSGIIAGVIGDPTPVKTFTTPDPRIYNCGESDLPFMSSTYTVLENATVGTQVQIGQFIMTMTEVNELGGGHYAGKGTIPIAFLAGAKAKVRFDDILIDTEYMVREGRVDVITKGLDNWLDEQFQQFIDPYFVDGTIDSAWVDTTAGVAWVTVDGVDTSFTFNPPTQPIIVNDENGNQYTIYPNGTIIVGTYFAISENWAVMPDEVIHFSQNDGEARGFDGKEHLEWYENYEIMQLVDSSKYFVANKSLAKGEGDIVNVEIPAGANASFQFSDGTTVNAVPKQGDWLGETHHINSQKKTLIIPARSSSGNYSIYAMVGNQKVGQLNVRVYPKKEKELIVVPLVNNFNLDASQIKNDLDNTLGEANIDVNVIVAAQWNDSDFTDTTNIILPSEVGLLNKYSDQMKNLRDHYFYWNDQMPTNAHYIFVVNGFNDPSENGYMPRGSSFGFVKFNQSDLVRTISHELAHGMGSLEHTWANGGPDQGATENLMDYPLPTAVDKRNLTKFQWKELRDFDFLPSVFDDAQDASSAETVFAGLDDPIWSTETRKKIDKSYFPNGAVFVAGENTFFKFTDEADSKISALLFTNGILSGFEVSDGNTTHEALLTRKAYHLESEAQYSPFRNVLNISESNYIFLCTDSSHTSERILETVQQGVSNFPSVVKGYCDHDFRLGVELEHVECYDAPPTVIYGIDPVTDSVYHEYPDCPNPVNNDIFIIPKTWRNKTDNSVCFMTPDGKTIKMSPVGIRAVDFSFGLEELDEPMLPAGCLIGFTIRDINGTTTNYKASIVNGSFNGYESEDGSTYFSQFKSALAADTGIIVMPDKNGLGVYYFDATQNTYLSASSTGGSVLDMSTDRNAIAGFNISSFSYMNYGSTDLTNGVIDEDLAYQIFPIPSTYSLNQEHRLIVKIVELATAYPELYNRMSNCNFRQWTGIGCLSTNFFTNLSFPTTDHVIAAALTDNTQWGYFDYWYDINDYGNTKTPTEQLELFLFHFREVIAYNRLMNAATIAEFLDPANCSQIYTSTSSPSGQWQPQTIFDALNAMSISEIESICTQTRVNLIASLVFTPPIVSNDYEKSIYRLIKHTHGTDQYQLVTKLCTQEYNNVVLIKQIPERIDDQVMFFGDANYFSEIAKTLIFYYGKSPNELTAMNLSSLTNAQIIDYKKRIVTFNYTGFVKRLFTACGVPAMASTNGATISDAEIVKVGNTWKVKFEDNLETCFFNTQSGNQRSFNLMDALIISDDARLMEVIAENGQATTMPAFILYFLEEKAWAKTAVEVVETAVDALTLVIPGGQASNFMRFLNYADKVSSFTNLGANFTEVDNPTLSNFLSLTSGVLGLTNITGNGVNLFRGVSNGSGSADDVLNLISKNSSDLSVGHEKAINDLLEVIDDNTSVELLSVLGSDQAKASFVKLLEAEEDYLRQLNRVSLADQVKARVNVLKSGIPNEVVDLSLIQLINGGYPINAADFAGLNFSFDLVGNSRMKQIMEQRWSSQGFTAQEILVAKQKFAILNNKYPNGVTFSTEGFPIFSPYRYVHNGVPVEVDIGALHPNPPSGVSGSNGSSLDFKAADDLMKQIDPNWKKPAGYTWHHIENSTRLELVPSDIHQAVRHSGGRSTYSFITITDLQSAWKGGWSKQQVLTIAKGNRPKKASEYLYHSYVYNHIDKFNQEGAGFIVVKSWTEGGNPLYTALPARKFVGLKSEMDAIVAKYQSQNNDWTVLRDELNLGANTNLEFEEVYYITIQPNDARFSYDVPNGNEGGAIPNEWEPGGFTKNGIREAALIGSENIIHNKDISILLANFPNNWIKIR